MRVTVHGNYDDSETHHEGEPSQIEASLLAAHPWLQSPDPEDHRDIHALLEHLASGSAYDVEVGDEVPSAVVLVVTDAHGRVLFGKRADTGKFTLVAGGANPGEAPMDAARRELKEETNLDVVSITPLTVLSTGRVVLYCYSILASGVLHSRNDPDQEVPTEAWKWVDVSAGVPGNIWRNLAGPPGDDNLVRQLFDLKVAKTEWNWEAGFADLRKDNVLLGHPDPRERELALKLDGNTPSDVAAGILDPDPWVWRAAFNHPHAAHALDVLAASHRDAAGLPIYDRHDALMADPRCTPAHLASMHRAAQGDAELPIHVQAARVSRILGHPLGQHADLGGLEAGALHKHWAHDLIRNGSVNSPARASEEEAMPHLGHLVQAWHHHGASAKPMEPIEGGLYETGLVSPKAVYRLPGEGGTGGHGFIVKPYAEVDHPLAGWSEQTSQHLYHAAGIGHLHQSSFIAPHGTGQSLAPATVIHIEDAVPVHHHNPADVLRQRPQAAEEARKIALMDFLVRHDDRHSGNLMVRPDGTPMAIDNASAFGYKDSDGWNRFDKFTSGGTSALAGSDHKAYLPTLAWWKTVGPDVRRAFEERLDGIHSPREEDRLRRGFGARADRLDHWAAAAERGIGMSPDQLDPYWHTRMPTPMAKKLGDAGFIQEKHDRLRSKWPELTHRVDYDAMMKQPRLAHVEPGAQHFETNLNGPTEHKPVLGNFRGDEPKAVFQHGDARYMVKPGMGLQGTGGWAEQTSQHLYDAAGVGHLHQASHLTSHGVPGAAEPALVVHLAPNHFTMDEAKAADPDRVHKMSTPENQEALRRIGIMDFVTANHDRHPGNLMLGPTGRPLAIDHGQSFHNDLMYADTGDETAEGGYGEGEPDEWYKHLDSQDDGYDDLLRDNEALVHAGPMTPETFRWWTAAKPAIMARMDEQLQHIRDPEARERMRASFRHRVSNVQPMMQGNYAVDWEAA
jgi:ADP-ribose pyrophosphatase YjhB (NUDIX family)